MDQGMLEVMIPIIMFIVIGAVFIAAFYFKHRTKSIFAEKGYSADEIVKILNEQKSEKIKDPNRYLIGGIITLFVGVGFGVGKFMADYHDRDYLFVATITTFIAIGLLIANKYRTKK